MKSAIRISVMVFLVCFLLPAGFAQDAPKEKKVHTWWNEGYWQRPKENPSGKEDASYSG